uniref:Uncharacterized protein n=1 Tax=Arundo donax TaxID=35708 RepID=A0A0A8YRM7_ARUDO
MIWHGEREDGAKNPLRARLLHPSLT